MKPSSSLISYENYSFEHNELLRDFVLSGQAQKVIDSLKHEVILVLGWDGAMLSAVSEYADKELPFLGINFGHKGFLLNHLSWIQENTSYTSRQYPLLEVRFWENILGTAFNDVHIYSPEGKVVELDISHPLGNLSLRGDGCIVATPAGSTGHSKSYLGPVLPHNTSNLVLTPKGNIAYEGAKILPQTGVLKIVKVWRKQELNINLDGRKVLHTPSQEDMTLHISLAKKQVEILISKKYEQEWDAKVMQEQGFKF